MDEQILAMNADYGNLAILDSTCKLNAYKNWLTLANEQ